MVWEEKLSSHLPHGLQVIADATSIEVALELAMERGGSRMTIPQNPGGTILENIVGIDAARKIVNQLAGERIEIPTSKRLLSDWLRAQGWSQERRAMKLKTARRTIQGWDKGTTPTRQIDLFDKSA